MLGKQIDLKSDIKISGTINCDTNRIHQVFANLIKNAIDFVPEKDGKIIIRAEDYKSDVLFTVEDNGKGFPLDEIDGMFHKFYQIDKSPTRKHGGTGLGLAICKGIIELHDGKIWIDKNYTNGAAVKFTIPKANT
jgi:signal transduction histidine kinase